MEKTLKSPLDCKEIQRVHPKGNKSWIFIGSTDAEAETPLLLFGYLMWRTDSLEKTLMLGKIWGHEEKGMTEDEMVGWHHWLDGHGFGWALGVGDGQGGLACCNSWGRKESDTTERLNWTELNWALKCAQMHITVMPALFPHRNHKCRCPALRKASVSNYEDGGTEKTVFRWHKISFLYKRLCSFFLKIKFFVYIRDHNKIQYSYLTP